MPAGKPSTLDVGAMSTVSVSGAGPDTTLHCRRRLAVSALLTLADKTSCAEGFTKPGGDAAMAPTVGGGPAPVCTVSTGVDTTTPVHAVSPLLCKVTTKEAGDKEVRPVTSPVATLKLGAEMLNATSAAPACSACRRPVLAASPTLEIVIMLCDTLSDAAKAALKPTLEAVPKEAAV